MTKKNVDFKNQSNTCLFLYCFVLKCLKNLHLLIIENSFGISLFLFLEKEAFKTFIK